MVSIIIVFKHRNLAEHELKFFASVSYSFRPVPKLAATSWTAASLVPEYHEFRSPCSVSYESAIAKEKITSMSRTCSSSRVLYSSQRPGYSAFFALLGPSSSAPRRYYHAFDLHLTRYPSPLPSTRYTGRSHYTNFMSRRHTTKSSDPSSSTSIPPKPTSSSSSSTHKHDNHDHSHDHDHDHEHKHGGLFHAHTHDHTEGAEQLMKAFRSGQLDRGTRITLLGKLRTHQRTEASTYELTCLVKVWEAMSV